MRKFGIALVVAAAFGLAAAAFGSAQAAVAGPSAQLGVAAGTLSSIEKTDFVFGGRAHCWYNRGWHGPGWYWCGYRWRRGLGWGGPRGWNGWVYSGWGPGPAVVVRPGAVVVAPGCRWVRQRIVRPDGVVVVRRVRVCR